MLLWSPGVFTRSAINDHQRGRLRSFYLYEELVSLSIVVALLRHVGTAIWVNYRIYMSRSGK